MDEWSRKRMPWEDTQPERVLELERLAQNLPPCSASIRFVPVRDESGECHGEFVFHAAEVEAIMAKRLAELSPEEHGIYPAILTWLRLRDASCAEPTDIPAAWHRHFLQIAIGMMNRSLGQVMCRECGESVSWEQVSLGWSPKMAIPNGWVYEQWLCPCEHNLLTRESMHFFARRPD